VVEQEVDPPGQLLGVAGGETELVTDCEPTCGAQRRVGDQRREAGAERLEQGHPLELDLGGMDQQIRGAHQGRHVIRLDDADLRWQRQRG
jgi:hypothetical protein